ncbi:hypothetical protein, conserved [Babesia ovata]|uniref:C3H1-type domain-containing protein n=1 Tax=Babesia ovata TaxID=189622 RepID=A0A2H6KJY0_9APIC|nr:uncharacterized protein BOVATA_047890 [Babesia ovata]GBE63296.1 hypothetical protein, conserved [Babesia ovata]
MCHFTSSNCPLTLFPLSFLTSFALPPWPPSLASIDWLIQVKHGNGGDGKGLEELAKALKKLIGDAIKKADDSLKEKEDELKCADKYDNEHHNKHCKSLKDQIATANEPEKSKKKSVLKKHYDEVHYLTENARQRALDDIDARRISLGQLAGQLSGLIGGGDEVKDAILRGLHSNVTQLEKLLNASCGDEGCDCNIKNFRDNDLKNLQEHFNEIDEIETKINSLQKQKDEKSEASVGTPSGSESEIERQIEAEKKKLDEQNKLLERQITQLQKQLEEPKEQINKKIQELTDKIAELQKEIEQYKEAQNPDKKVEDISIPYNLSNSLETEQAKLKSHKASLESLDSLGKLMKFHQSVENADNKNCKDILDKLCTGLQTFLGYNSNSKGYTGEGIVYSDLDRLCDGVMSFLLECLKGSEPLLKHYYGDITNTITELESKIGKGLGVPEFAQAIGIVQAGLERYESGMEERINRFKSWYDAMMNTEIKDLKGEMSTFHDKNLEDQLKAVSSKAKMCLHRATFGEKSKSELDEKLREMLDKPVSLIKQAAHDFREINENGLLNHQARAVDTALQTQQAALNNAINTGSQKFQNTVGGEFDKIRSSLNDLKENTLKTEMQKVRSAVEDAKVFVQDCITDFDKIYEHNILNEFNSINQQMTDITKSNKSVKYESKLFEEVEKLNKAVLELEKLYQGKLVDVKKKVDKAVGLTDNEPGSVLAELTKLDDHLRTDLERVRGDIKLQIDGYIDHQVRGFMKAVKQAWNAGSSGAASMLYSSLNGDLKNSFQTVHAPTSTYITSALKAINSDFKLNSGSPIPDPDTLHLIRNLKTDIENTLKKVITDPKENIKINESFMNHYYVQTMKEERREGALRTKIKQIKGKFGGGFQGDGENTKIHLETLEGYNTPPSTSSSSEGAKPAYNKAVASVKQMVDKMERLPEFVEQRKLAADEIMKDIKTKFTTLQGMIDDVDLIVNAAEKGLQNAIDSVGNAVKKTEQDITQESKNLQAQLLAAVKSSFDTVKNSVQSLFARQKQAELTQLQSVVTEQLEKIEEIIREDKSTGVKGFLTILREGMFENFLSRSHPLKDGMKLSELAVQAVICFEGLFEYFDEELTPKNSRLVRTLHSQSTGPHAAMVENIRSVLNALLGHLINTNLKTYDFDHTFREKVHELTVSVGALSAKTFGEGRNPELLNIFKSGMSALTTELSRAYVNVYSGKTFSQLVIPKTDSDPQSSDKLTPEGRNCAKVCLTILERVSHDLMNLRKACNKNTKGKWHDKSIYLYENGKKGEHTLGDWLKKHGFTVPKDKDTQNGELNKDKKGNEIYDLLVKDDEKHVYKKDNSKEDEGPLRTLRRHLEQYYKVSHYNISAKPKAPTTVNQMLQWLTGLQYNPVYAPLCNYFKQLFPKPKGDERDYKEIPSDQLKLEYHQYARITHTELTDTLETLCRQSEKMLITFLGHGHADGIYAVEFSNNSNNLFYPDSPATCLDMLVNVLNRVHYQLNFIYKMCHNGRSRGGWEECHYGRYIGGSHWNCNEKQCPNQNADQKGDQTCTQKHAQNCDQRVSCGLKSPLQSFLEDGLPGFLPHQFKKPGCKLECTVPNHQGIPCLTPMGFADISQAASHTKTGKHLFGALYYFCGTTYALTKLCSALNCLLRTPPKSLGDMLAFYHKFLENYSRQKHKQIAFDEAVRKANFGNPDTKLDIVSIQGSKSHTAKHSQGDLFGIISCNTSESSKNPVVPCGSYMQPLTLDVVSLFSEMRAANYLSWIVYITETFYDLLKKLYEDCCNNCNKPGTKCHDKACDEKCTVKSLYETPKYAAQSQQSSPQHQNVNHIDGCNSIVECTNMHPLLYKYGFTFESPYDLSGKNGIDKQRSCKDFCMALRNVIEDARKGALEDIDARRISLGQLAGQLSGLIGGSEEVKNAILNGLYSNVTQLEKRLQASCGGEGCDCNIKKFRDDLKNLQDTFKKYDEIATKIDSLQKDIAEKSKAPGKAPSGGGPEIAELNEKIEAEKKKLEKENESLNEQIKELKSALNASKMKIDEYIQKLTASVRKCEEEIKQYKKDEKQRHKKQYNEDLKDADISIPSHLSNPLATEQAKLKSHEASLESLKNLEKLIAFHESVEKNQDGECLSILNNLCTGLEKFLGYQETSKGYDGEGIVYSDLDRLCDGVMSFLHGVLHNIKPKLGLHKESINDAIKSLNTNKHSGKEGFNAAIGEVVQGVREYNEGVRRSNESVKSVINNFIGDVILLGSDLNNFTGHNHVDVINVKVEACINHAKDYAVGMEHAERHVKDLQDELESKVRNATKNIEYQAQQARSIHASQKKELERVTRLVESELREAKERINETVKRDITELFEGLNVKITALKGEIQGVNDVLEKHVSELGELINKAHEAVVAAMAQVEKILDEVGNQSPQNLNKQELLRAIGTLEQKGVDFYNAYDTAKKDLPNVVRNVTKAVEGLDGKIQKDLEILRAVIDAKILQYVKKAKEQFKAIKDEIGDTQGTPSTDSVLYNWSRLIHQITWLTGKIYEKNKSMKKEGFLGDIMQHVDDYVAKFKDQETFGEKVLKEWVGDILGLGNHRLDTYVSTKKGSFKDKLKSITSGKDDKLRDPIKKVFKNKLAEANIYNGKVSFLTETTKNITNDLIAVKTACEQFAQQLNEKIDGGRDYTFAGEIADQIETDGPDGILEKPSKTGDQNLKMAIYQILLKLAAKAKSTATQLDWLVKTGGINGNIGKVNEAITKITEIKTRLGDGKNQEPGSKITQALEEVKLQIRQLNDTLNTEIEKQIGWEFEGADSDPRKVPDLMTNYRDHVGDGGFPSETSVQGNIKKLQETALNPLKNLADKINAKSIGGDANIVRANLGRLCTAILNAASARKDSAHKKLGELKTLISRGNTDVDNTLSKLREGLNNLRVKTLFPLIQQAETITEEASVHSKKMIWYIEHQVTQQLNGARDTITQALQTKYVLFLKSQLTEFSTKCQSELNDLPAQITADAEKGFKGFMGVLHEKLTEIQLPTNLDGNSKLRDLSPRTKAFFSSLLDTLNGNKDIMAKPLKINELSASLNILFADLNKYNRDFQDHLAALGRLIRDMRPTSYNDERNPLLQILRGGVHLLYNQLEMAYVSSYDSEQITWEYNSRPTPEAKQMRQGSLDNNKHCSQWSIQC